MICPIKAREYPMDGQSIECNSECPWALTDIENPNRYACAVAIIAAGVDDYITWTVQSEVDE